MVRPDGGARVVRNRAQPGNLARGTRSHREGRPGRGAAGNNGPARVGEPVRPHIACRVSPWPTPTSSPVLTSTTSRTHRTGGMDMRQKLLRMARGNDVEVGVAIPIGCMVPLAIAAAVLVGAGVLVGTHMGASRASDRATLRVIDDS